MHTAIKKLPDSELEIMQVIWDLTPPVSKADIEHIIYQTHPMAETTLLTLLSRLTEKGFLHVTIQKRKKYYTPAVAREDYLIIQSRSFIQKVCCGSVSAFANALCSGGLTKEEISELRALLTEETP